MTYGLKRWGMGMLFGWAATGGMFLLATDRPFGLTMLGVAIIAFSADFRIKPDHPPAPSVKQNTVSGG